MKYGCSITRMNSNWACALCAGIALLAGNFFATPVQAAAAEMGAVKGDLTGGDPLGSMQWPDMKGQFFEANEKTVFDSRIKVTVPLFAEDAMNVPVSFDASSIGKVKKIVVLVDRNPIRKVLEFIPEKAKPALNFRFKLEQASPIRIAALGEDNVWHVGYAFIEAAGGGCTVPGATRLRPEPKPRAPVGRPRDSIGVTVAKAAGRSMATVAAREAANMVDLDSDPTKLLDVVQVGKELLVTRGALTTFSIANDVAKYFAILPALFVTALPALAALNAGCDLALLCNQSLKGSKVIDEVLDGLAEAQVKGWWQPDELSEARRVALLPTSPALAWDDLVRSVNYQQALASLP